MRVLHMAPQTLLIRELLLVLAVVHKTVKRSQLHALYFRVAIGVVYGLICAVLITLVSLLVVKFLPCERLVRRNDDFIKLRFA